MNWNWNETSIKLPYTSEKLRTLLDTVCKKENGFSQYDFAMWCDNLTMAFDDDEGDELNDFDSLVFSIARDIECQWDLYWFELHSFEELRKIDHSKLEIPLSWFIEWSKKLREYKQL